MGREDGWLDVEFWIVVDGARAEVSFARPFFWHP